MAADHSGFNLLGPITGNQNINVSKADPEIRMTDTGNDEYTRVIKSDTTNEAERLNRISEVTSNGLLFDGSDEWIDTTITDMDGVDKFTITFWAKSTSSGVHKIVFGNEGGDNNIELGFNYGGVNSKIQIIAAGGGASNTVKAWLNVTEIHDGSWHQYTFGIDMTSSAGSFLYVDNVLQTMTNVSFTSGGFGAAFSFSLAIAKINRAGSGNNWPGTIDEFAIWNDKVSVNDVGDLWNSGSGLYINPANNWPTDGGSIGTDMLVLYHLDSSSGSTATDSSGNGNDGTLTNMEDADWVAGKVTAPALPIEKSVWKHNDNGMELNDTGVNLQINGAPILPSYTTAGRDALSAVNGMIIYNTTTNAVNAYENGAWVDL